MEKIYDMVIVGGRWPGGYTAALYAARAGLDAVVLEKLSAGGQMALSQQLDNYPGFEEGIEGFFLAEKMQQGAERFGSETKIAEVTEIHLAEDPKRIVTSEGVFYSRTVVFATGADPEKNRNTGRRQVFRKRYQLLRCMLDGMFCEDMTATVIGGGNSAAADAMLLSRIAEKVVLINRTDRLSATKIYHKPLMETENIEIIWNSVAEEFIGDDKLESVRIKNSLTGEESMISCNRVFISIGRKPATELVQGQLQLDSSGYITAGESTETDIPGVFAVGDVRTKPLRQVVTAISDGAVAIYYAEKYLTSH